MIIHNGANSSVGKALVRIAALRGLKTISVLRDRWACNARARAAQRRLMRTRTPHSHDYAENADYLKNKGSFLVCNEHFLLSQVRPAPSSHVLRPRPRSRSRAVAQEYREVMADVSTPVLGLNCVNGRIGVDTARALGCAQPRPLPAAPHC